MKKLITLLLIVFSSSQLFGQILTANNIASFNTWTIIDQDGDTYEWVPVDLTGGGQPLEAQGECIISNSWNSTAGALTPDNILLSPSMNFTGQSNVSLTYSVGSNETTASGWYEEYYSVYATNDLASTLTPIYSEVLPGGAQMYTRTLDLSMYDGDPSVYIVFRHYNCTDENYIVLDDVIVQGSGTPCNMTASATSTPETTAGANNGTATVTTSNGTSPYTYSWSPSGANTATATGLSPGTHTVTVTDGNGCTATASTTVGSGSQPCNMTLSISSTNETTAGANNGTATVTPSNGSAPYTYSWSPSGGNGASATGLSPGTYTVTVTDNAGCTSTASTTIQPGSSGNDCGLSVVATGVDPISNGTYGSASAIASGGTGPYTYIWGAISGGYDLGQNIGGLYPGNMYTVTVVDEEGCVAYDTIFINPFNCDAEMTATFTTAPSDDNFCTGTVEVNVTGGNPSYTYQWYGDSFYTYNNISGLCSGGRVLRIKDANGCVMTTAYAINSTTCTNPVSLTAEVTPMTGQFTYDASITVTATGGDGTYSYDWEFGPYEPTYSDLSPGTYVCTVYSNGCYEVITVEVPPYKCLLTAEIETTSPSVAGGSDGTATIIPINGTPPYNYWYQPNTDPTLTGMTGDGIIAGYLSDAAGCETVVGGYISDPACALSVSFNSNNESAVDANDGSATAVVTNGLGSYTYTWSPNVGSGASINNLSPGTYTLTVTDGECTTTASITIEEFQCNTSLSLSGTNETANGANNGSATATITGGTGPYTYQWSPSGANTATVTGLEPGVHTVTVTDAQGCIETNSIFIAEYLCNLDVAVSSNNVSSVGGSNGSINLTPVGGSGPYTYSWFPDVSSSNSASGLTQGEYEIVVTDNAGCSATVIAVVNNPGCNINFSNVSSTDETSYNANDGTASVTPFGGASPYSYEWHPTGGTSSSASNLSPGVYTVVVTDNVGCMASEVIVILEAQSTASIEPKSITSVLLYPNPIMDKLTVESNEVISEIIITDINGKSIINKEGGTELEVIDISMCKPGVYLCTVITTNNRTITRRIIKN